MINAKENKDGSFTISWDKDDPQESILNKWKEQDFIEVIKNYVEALYIQRQYTTHPRAKSLQTHYTIHKEEYPTEEEEQGSGDCTH